MNRSRGGGNVEIAASDFQGVWEGMGNQLVFLAFHTPSFPRPCFCLESLVRPRRLQVSKQLLLGQLHPPRRLGVTFRLVWARPGNLWVNCKSG